MRPCSSGSARRATYGDRRVKATVTRTVRTGHNRTGIRRAMHLHGLMLPGQ
jgi:hypothetical protein